MEVKDNIKICNYVIENSIKLLKSNMVDKVNVLVLPNIINIEIDNNFYIITGMISYKHFIDIISNDYKIILKYIPRFENSNIYESMKHIYLKHHQVNINIQNTNKVYKNIV